MLHIHLVLLKHSCFGFGPGYATYEDWPVNQPAILFDFFDSVNLNSYVSPPQNGTTPGVKFVRIVVNATDFVSFSNNDTTIKKNMKYFM